MISWLDIVLLSVVEGITEFLPVSSTGHMIIVKDFLGLEKTAALDAFLVIVQSGAILAVVTLFLPLFLNWLRAWWALAFQSPQRSAENIRHRQQSLFVALSVLPFATVGFLNKDFIKGLFSVQVVAWALITGGLLILLDEFVLSRRRQVERSLESLTLKDALLIGVGQCLALWPGFSRSAATIVAGRAVGFSRAAAAEVSFLLGLPALLGTAGYEAIKEFRHLNGEWLGFLLVGIGISWVVAYVCVRTFVAFLKRFPLSVFAYYRIVLGIVLIAYFGAHQAG